MDIHWGQIALGAIIGFGVCLALIIWVTRKPADLDGEREDSDGAPDDDRG